jgi:23S rRNA pseudouridine955/2504/2580 synthase
MKRLIVNKKYENQKLNKYLQENISNLTNNLFYKTLRKKDIKVNGKRINENIMVHENDEILVYIANELLEPGIKLDIVYEDENILIINKPSNIEVTGTQSLTEVVHKKYSNCGFLPMPCHRLDRNTTGLILFAKNQQSLDILLEKFRNHEIEKHYLALVYGQPKVKEQKLIAYLFKDSKKSLVYISDEPKKGYSKIITSYSLLEKYPNNTSLLDVQIETGKTHQIRAHLAHIGFPIVGDGKYGNYDINKKLGIKIQQLTSYKLKFNFSSNSGILDYLNKKEFMLK